MTIAIIMLQGLFELVGISCFISGYFIDVEWLMITGGIMIIVDDIIEMYMGILNPLFPVVLAFILAFILTPWYVGIFWASASFKIFGIPTAIIKLFTPKKYLALANKLTVDV